MGRIPWHRSDFADDVRRAMSLLMLVLVIVAVTAWAVSKDQSMRECPRYDPPTEQRFEGLRLARGPPLISFSFR